MQDHCVFLCSNELRVYGVRQNAASPSKDSASRCSFSSLVSCSLSVRCATSSSVVSHNCVTVSSSFGYFYQIPFINLGSGNDAQVKYMAVTT